MRYFLLSLGLLTSMAHASSQISMTSDNGDYIGAGNNYTLLASDINSTEISDSRISISTNVFSMSFSAPNNRKIAAGGFFNAERDPFRGPLNPGIDIGGQGRGCNTIKGEFYIYEVDIASSKLALDFVQHCEGGTAALRGSIRINSNTPIPYTGVLAIATASTINALEGSAIDISAEKSVSNPAPAGYKWEQTKGKTTSILNTSASKTTITLPSDVNLGGEDLEFKLTVTSTANVSASTNLIIHASSKSDPQTYLQFSGAANDYISRGKSYYFDNNNSTISLSTSDWSNAVTLSVSSSSWWDLNFSAPGNTPLAIKNYPYAERYPFQATTAAGLSISGDGRGCNQSFGTFEIKQLRLADPIGFKASFEQHCESTTAPALKGEVAYNAVNDKVPTAAISVIADTPEGTTINLDASNSFDPKGSSLSFSWSTDQPGLIIKNADTSRPNFVAPSLPNRITSKFIKVTLVIKNAEGYKAQQTASVNIINNNKAPIAIDDALTVTPNIKTVLHPLNNDTDSDGILQVDTINIKTQPLYGDVIVNSDGTLDYVQNKGAATADKIQYTVKDNDGTESIIATINLTIKAESTTSSSPNDGKKSGGGSSNLFFLLLLGSLLINRKQLIALKNTNPLIS